MFPIYRTRDVYKKLKLKRYACDVFYINCFIGNCHKTILPIGEIKALILKLINTWGLPLENKERLTAAFIIFWEFIN
jgi:hypothetical protein